MQISVGKSGNIAWRRLIIANDDSFVFVRKRMYVLDACPPITSHYSTAVGIDTDECESSQIVCQSSKGMRMFVGC